MITTRWTHPPKHTTYYCGKCQQWKGSFIVYSDRLLPDGTWIDASYAKCAECGHEEFIFHNMPTDEREE